MLKYSILFILFTGCATVNEYEKVYVNQPQMKLGSRALDGFENDFESYREGSVGGNSGNKGGGCGCN